MDVSPSPSLAPLNADQSSRSPEGTRLPAALSHGQPQAGRLGSGPALGPEDAGFVRRECVMDN